MPIRIVILGIRDNADKITSSSSASKHWRYDSKHSLEADGLRILWQKHMRNQEFKEPQGMSEEVEVITASEHREFIVYTAMQASSQHGKLTKKQILSTSIFLRLIHEELTQALDRQNIKCSSTRFYKFNQPGHGLSWTLTLEYAKKKIWITTSTKEMTQIPTIYISFIQFYCYIVGRRAITPTQAKLGENASTAQFYFTENEAINYFTLLEQRPSVTHIARLAKIPVLTVEYNIARIKEQGTVRNRCRNGRPRKITAVDDEALGQWIPCNRETTAKELAQKLLQDRGRLVSLCTVRRQLKRMD
ncbi:unnamed protein product [Darwinula stevensoni]|uniref:Uncharacterized protein n=1 Tax=Darwinula stevensoni TaxID=69355 RepID=A0A7R8X799_9CRUS|nr:unnamed protein product [Darwinula stevensoni]CAG0882988.1 unnamed protein product [Darwinula stevensoni]